MHRIYLSFSHAATYKSATTKKPIVKATISRSHIEISLPGLPVFRRTHNKALPTVSWWTAERAPIAACKVPAIAPVVITASITGAT